MLVVPFAHDQPDKAERVFRLGVARVVYPHHYTAKRVRAELEALLGHRETADRAVELGDIVRSENGGATAAAELSRLSGRTPATA